MLVLILLLVLGSGLVYISKYNFAPVTVNLVFYTAKDIPLFYVIIVSLLVGLILSYLINALQGVARFFSERGKNKEIRQGKQEVLELTKTVHQLELENEKIKNGTSTVEPTDPLAL